MSASPLHVLLLPTCAFDADAELTCLHMPSRVQASMGVSTRVGTIGSGFGGGLHSACWDLCKQWRHLGTVLGSTRTQGALWSVQGSDLGLKDKMDHLSMT